jgi:fused signal recognition particle receptor
MKNAPGFLDGSQGEKYNWRTVLGNLRDKLLKTSRALRDRLDDLLKSGKSREQVLSELEEVLILSDMGVSVTAKIIRSLRENTRKDEPLTAIRAALQGELTRILSQYPTGLAVDSEPAVIMMVGVNGGGKTTSLAKLARHFQSLGKKVELVGADTFRAAAQEQLLIWGKRLGLPVVRGQYGADPAAVVFDAVQSFKARGYDVLLVDTAGRIHTNTNLMNELEKVRRVIEREIPGAPQEILLVLDSTTGQNAIVQAREFLRFMGITGIFLTKLDGTARGGSTVSIVDELKLPIKLIGTGEGAEDMMRFSPEQFAAALIS